MSRRIVRPKVDLPQPDSPTKPTVSPSLMVRLTPSTALTAPLLRKKNPSPTGKCFLRLRISNRLMVFIRIPKSRFRIPFASAGFWLLNTGFLLLHSTDLPLSQFSVREMAGHRVACLLLKQLRLALRTQIGRLRATVAKTASAREVQRVRHDAGNRVQAFFLCAAD